MLCRATPLKYSSCLDSVWLGSLFYNNRVEPNPVKILEDGSKYAILKRYAHALSQFGSMLARRAKPCQGLQLDLRRINFGFITNFQPNSVNDLWIQLSTMHNRVENLCKRSSKENDPIYSLHRFKLYTLEATGKQISKEHCTVS